MAQDRERGGVVSLAFIINGYGPRKKLRNHFYAVVQAGLGYDVIVVATSDEVALIL